MKFRELDSGLLIPTNPGYANHAVLRNKMRAVALEHEHAVPPVVVVHSSKTDTEFISQSGEYLILNGNHGAVAYTLLRDGVSVVELGN